MSLISKLTYEDKENPNSVTDRKKQATAEDFNEIKEVVNNCVDGLNWIKCDEVALIPGENTITFSEPYPTGIQYAIIVHNCVNSKGYLQAHTIPNATKTKNGFKINVESACTLLYMTAPRR